MKIEEHKIKDYVKDLESGFMTVSLDSLFAHDLGLNMEVDDKKTYYECVSSKKIFGGSLSREFRINVVKDSKIVGEVLVVLEVFKERICPQCNGDNVNGQYVETLYCENCNEYINDIGVED